MVECHDYNNIVIINFLFCHLSKVHHLEMINVVTQVTTFSSHETQLFSEETGSNTQQVRVERLNHKVEGLIHQPDLNKQQMSNIHSTPH